MKTLHQLLVLAVLAPAAAGAQAPNPAVPVLTLSEARDRAALVDRDAVAARSDVQTAVWERRSALTNLLTPHLSASTSYIRFSDPFFNFGTGRISPNATSATLDASYSVLGAGKIAGLKHSRAALASAEANETAASFRVAYATDAAYYGVLAARDLLRVTDDRLHRAEEQFGLARVRVQAGEAIATDSLQLLLEVNRAKLARLRADSSFAVARLHLGRLVGLDGPAEAAPVDWTVPPPLPLTQEQAVAELHTHGPALLAARAGERSAEAMVSVQRGGYLPDISVGATTGAYDAEFFPSAFKRAQVALTVSLPLWDGGQRELALARARAERNVARAEREDRERGAAEAVAQSYHGYETARAGIELAVVGTAVAQENYRVQRARYREGATTILDLLEAQVALSESEAALVQARYATQLALAQLETLLGRRIFDNPNPNPANR
ncbi:MAG TPA: TolC family protein [Longimicrobiales bacterium]